MKRFAGLVAILILTMHEGLAGNFASERSDEVVFHVSAPTRITPEDAAPHFWWRPRASPSSPKHMILCAIRNEPETAKALQNIIYGSTDGGLSWSLLMEDSGYAISSEAECAIDGDNHIYFVSSRSGNAWNPKEKPPSDSFVFKSEDNGQTWTPSERIPYYLDSTIILVGENRHHKKKTASIYFNNLGEDIKGASGAIIHSTDGAHTFSPPAAFPAPPGRSRNAYGWFMDAVLFRSGASGGVWIDPIYRLKGGSGITVAPEANIIFQFASKDAEPNARPTRIAALSPAFLEFLEATPHNGFWEVRDVSMAVGPTPEDPTAERLYVVWHDLTGERMRIHLAMSDDLGRSWSSPRIIDDTPSKKDGLRDMHAARPNIAVNRYGAVAVQWGEFEGACWRIAMSVDGAMTFSPSKALHECETAQPLREAQIADYLRAVFHQDDAEDPSAVSLSILDWRPYWRLARPSALDARADGAFQAAWIAHTVDDHAVFTARIGAPMPMTPACAASFEPVSKKSGRVRLEYATLDYDPDARAFSVGVAPVMDENVSATSFIFELRSAESPLGPVEAANADNGLKGAGARWLFHTDAPPPGPQSSAVSRFPNDKDRLRFAGGRQLKFQLAAPPETSLGLKAGNLRTPPSFLNINGVLGTADCD